MKRKFVVICFLFINEKSIFRIFVILGRYRTLFIKSRSEKHKTFDALEMTLFGYKFMLS